jgi:hypothetical protein
LLERVAGGERLLFRFAPLVFKVYEQRRQFLEFPRQRLNFLLVILDGGFQVRAQFHHIAQLSFQ